MRLWKGGQLTATERAKIWYHNLKAKGGPAWAKYKERTRVANRKYKSVHPERVKAFNARRIATPWAEQSPERLLKLKARNKVAMAMRIKTLTRKSCEICGARNVQAHHDDYSKPLEVRWLCHKHHVEVHHVRT